MTKDSSASYLIIAFFFLIGLLIIYPAMIHIYWPYLLMSIFGFVLIKTMKIQDIKLTSVLIVLFISLMALMQITFYFILPLTNNYQPTPTVPKMQMFDLAGKFQISYYPDIPKAGEEVLLYFEVCDVGLVNCAPCQICTLTGKFIDEKGGNKILFSNLSTNKTEPIIFLYPGREVEINLDFEGIDNRYDTFYVPKLNFVQLIIYIYKEHIIISLISIISLIVFVVGFPYSIYRFIKNSNLNFYLINERKLKMKIREILNGR